MSGRRPSFLARRALQAEFKTCNVMAEKIFHQLLLRTASNCFPTCTHHLYKASNCFPTCTHHLYKASNCFPTCTHHLYKALNCFPTCAHHLYKGFNWTTHEHLLSCNGSTPNAHSAEEQQAYHQLTQKYSKICFNAGRILT